VVVVVVVVAVAYVKPHVLNGILRRFIVVDVDAYTRWRLLYLQSYSYSHMYITYIFFMVKFNFII
jgi:hypothetical protein